MESKNVLRILTAAMLLGGNIVNAQTGAGGTGSGGGICNNCIQPADGNGTLGLTYRRDTCGLNYKSFSLKIGQRFLPAGAIQPVTLAVSGLTATMVIEKAFLWADASGTGIPVTFSVTNPASVTQSIAMSLIGSEADKCWNYVGTYTYRADVTGMIAGNGNYIFSGFPTGAVNDVDGILLMIIYVDTTSLVEGHILIHDGAKEISGGNTIQTIPNLNVCSNSTYAHAFMVVADLQGLGSSLSMNNGPNFGIVEDWWNYIDQPTAQLTPSQTTSDFAVSSVNDCYNFLLMGLYYQTTCCMTCSNPGGPLSVSTTGVGTCAPNSGSATASASGAQSPYSYVWQPGGSTTATINNLSAGTYTVLVTDSSGCITATDTVVVPMGSFPVAQFSVSPSSNIYFPGQICMTDLTTGGTGWTWFINGVPIDTNSTYCYTLPDTGYYCMQLLVVNADACPDTAEQCVTVSGEAVISVPNVFTPNEDGNNDIFFPTCFGVTNVQCAIYDRWGVKVYEWTGLTGGWDGRADSVKQAADGIYYYVLDVTTLRGETKQLHGFVHLFSR